LREREEGLDDVDEEAVTDIEMGNTAEPAAVEQTPIKIQRNPATPPPTNRATRSAKKAAAQSPAAQLTPVPEAEATGPTPTAIDSSFGSASSALAGKRGKKTSPFDSWPRAKAGKRRAGEALEEDAAAGAKRTRGAALVESPA